MEDSLRQRIRKCKISCKPWKRYGAEIKYLPVSSQTLFSNKGMAWDILEIELQDEGWLEPEESIWEVLADLNRLMMPHLSEVHNKNEDPFDDSWTEEDYIFFYNNGGSKYELPDE